MNKGVFKAVKYVFYWLPLNEVFTGNELIRRVRNELYPKTARDGTILRELRRVREKGFGWYENIDQQRSLYIKMSFPKKGVRVNVDGQRDKVKVIKFSQKGVRVNEKT